MNTHGLTTRFSQIFLLGALIAIALGMNYLQAWTGPSAAAPNGNVDAPLNIGTTAQVKDGNLSVGRSTNTASDFGLISYGKVRSTVGGFQFPDGTVQATAASSTGSAIVRTGFISGLSSGAYAGPQSAIIAVNAKTKLVKFDGYYGTPDETWTGGFIVRVGGIWEAHLIQKSNQITFVLSTTERCTPGSVFCARLDASGNIVPRIATGIGTFAHFYVEES